MWAFPFSCVDLNKPIIFCFHFPATNINYLLSMMMTIVLDCFTNKER